MAEQSAKDDCYGLKILLETMCQEAKARVGLMHREIKAHKRVREGKRVLSINSNALLRIVCREPTNQIQEHKSIGGIT